ncbi:Nucleotide-binding universal stress protein, UspA family [Desulfocicer vacuolatum DSM 3385]|uniref:Nucleotide-binding universal stress protein, UspA family n=1 Tax=Desulfocicer vacuolatum DSM 3385 TaxID=1121400 RepID=A0A1W2EGA2_9BACT|nr:universal stress protein [Desulfocicer vacuolatum]SMD08687.1 Nucleotide-binding universal stress protein, UspA family [Desulfocicer vacuolatum DSM 3385]
MRIQPQKIMCAMDFSDYSPTILSYSVALCKEFDARLFLCHVVMNVPAMLGTSETSLDPIQLQQSHNRSAQEMLEKMAAEVPLPCEVILGKGDAADELSRIAQEKEIDMVVTATQGQSAMARLLIGSVTEKLMKTIQCPLLVLHTQKHEFFPPPDHGIKMDKILVGCDFSSDSRLAFEYGMSLAQEFQASLHLAHVIKPTEHLALKPENDFDLSPGDYYRLTSPTLYLETASEKHETRINKIKEIRNKLIHQLHRMVPEESQHWCTPETILLDGEPYRELIHYAQDEEMDLIVLGIRGHTLLEKLMVGSTTHRLIRQSPCPVLAVRQNN